MDYHCTFEEHCWIRQPASVSGVQAIFIILDLPFLLHCMLTHPPYSLLISSRRRKIQAAEIDRWSQNWARLLLKFVRVNAHSTPYKMLAKK